MKKSVSLCLLSILVAMFIAVGAFLTPVQAQEPTPSPCCLWLENTDPPTPYELTTLEQHSSIINQNYPVDEYIVHFPECGISPNTKVSLSWAIYRDEVLLDESTDLKKLSKYAIVEFLTFYARADQDIYGGPLRGGIPGVYPPRVDDNNYADYPGATSFDPGYINMADGYALDYFNYGFFGLSYYYDECEDYLETGGKL